MEPAALLPHAAHAVRQRCHLAPHCSEHAAACSGSSSGWLPCPGLPAAETSALLCAATCPSRLAGWSFPPHLPTLSCTPCPRSCRALEHIGLHGTLPPSWDCQDPATCGLAQLETLWVVGAGRAGGGLGWSKACIAPRTTFSRYCICCCCCMRPAFYCTRVPAAALLASTYVLWTGRKGCAPGACSLPWCEHNG